MGEGSPLNRNKTWLAWALSVGLIAYLLGAATISRSNVTGGDVVKAYASGTALHLDALQQGGLPDGTRVADVDVAFSAANADSTGFPKDSRFNENEVLVQPTPSDHTPPTPFEGKNASGRGGPLEVGLVNGVPTDPSTLLPLIARSGATAPPDSHESNELGVGAIIPGVAYASLLHSDALAQWQNSTCLTNAQSPIAYGRGYAADVQLIDQGTAKPDGSFGNPVVATDDPSPDRNAVTTWSYTYAVPNGAGKYGLVSEVHQTFAPIEVGRTLVIEVLGEWYTRTQVTGLAGGASVKYGVNDPKTGQPVDPQATVLRISSDGGITFTGLSLQDLQAGGINVPLGPLMSDITLGEAPRAITAPGGIPVFGSKPDLAADGTHAASASDVARVDLLDAPATFGSLADLRVGHFESDLTVPAGGFSCPTPSTTAAPTTTSTTGATTTTTAGPTTTTTAGPTTSTTAAPTTTTAATPTTLAPTTTAKPATTPSTAPPTTLPTRAEAAVAVRAQPRTVG